MGDTAVLIKLMIMVVAALLVIFAALTWLYHKDHKFLTLRFILMLIMAIIFITFLFILI